MITHTRGTFGGGRAVVRAGGILGHKEGSHEDRPIGPVDPVYVGRVMVIGRVMISVLLCTGVCRPGALQGCARHSHTGPGSATL